MAVSSFALSLIKRGLLRNNSLNCYVVMVRKVSTLEITKNLTLISHPSHPKRKPKIVSQLKLDIEEENKPLVVMLSWLMANKKHIVKYADFYLKRGFDVINISISPWQLLWPVKGTQLVAADILNFLHSNPAYGPLVIHGFSVGGYVWSEALVKMAAEQSKHQHIIDKISGQIWDSAADLTEIPVGLPYAVFPRNQVLQTALRKYVLYHLKAFDSVATKHYVRASQLFHANIVRAPALFFISKADPIGSERSNLRARESWENIGMKTYWKIWDDSPHVGHFRHYPQEYIDTLSKFIEDIGVLTEEEQQHKQEALKFHAKL